LSGSKLHYLGDCGLHHFQIEALTRAGKGVNSVVPALLAWRHSAQVYDLKGELCRLAAGARKRKGQLCFKIPGVFFLLLLRGTLWTHAP
jgi:type IV secretion system protein VirD4